MEVIEMQLEQAPLLWERRGELFKTKFNEHLLNYSDEFELCNFLGKYVDFNRAFAGAGLVLAGIFHSESELFGDIGSAKIACSVLEAIIDEYFTRNLKQLTHRELSNSFIENVYQFFNYTPNEVIHPTEAMCQKQIHAGYAMDKRTTVADLFQALGFHLATEMNGAIEFCAIDQYLEREHPNLVNFLKRQPGRYNTTAYTWIKIHTYVEDEHFAAAINSIKNAKMYYLGNLDQDEINSSIQKGIDQFYQFVDTMFFEDIHLSRQILVS